MKVIEVEYQKLKSEGFDHTKLACRIALGENDSPEEALKKAKDWVDKNIDNMTSPEISVSTYENALEIVTKASEKENILPF